MKRTDQQTACFCRELALLLHGGISPAESVGLMAGEDPLFAPVVEQLDRGTPLSEALEKSGLFEGYVSGFLAVGERTGALEQALDALGEHYGTRHQIRAALSRAIAWPVLLLGLMLVVMWVLLSQVLPVFDRVYASLGGGLTGPAAGLMALGQWKGLWLLIPIAACGIWRAAKTLPRRDWGIWAGFHNARYLQGAAMGLTCGLSEEEALNLARNLLTDAPGAFLRAEACAQLLDRGRSLPEALEETGFLDTAGRRLLLAGQRGGNADRVLARIARDRMDAAFDSLEAAVGRVEPLLVLTASALVGGILLTVMLPLMDILIALG